MPHPYLILVLSAFGLFAVTLFTTSLWVSRSPKVTASVGITPAVRPDSAAAPADVELKLAA